MALELASSLCELGYFSTEDILRRYMDWWQFEGFDAGFISPQVFSLIINGEPPSVAVSRVYEANGSRSAGCNPAHRSLPLAMTAIVADDQLAHVARQEAEITHLDPLAGDVAAATNILCRKLIRGTSWGDALAMAAVHRKPETICQQKT